MAEILTVGAPALTWVNTISRERDATKEVRTLAGREAFAILRGLLVLILALGAFVGCGAFEDQSQQEKKNESAQETTKEETAENVAVRVSGTEGVAYTGAYGLFEEAQRVEGTLGAEPTDYEIEVGGDDPGTVSAVFRKTEPSEGTLKVEILVDGEVVAEDETSAEYGVVRALWSPQGKATQKHPGER